MKIALHSDLHTEKSQIELDNLEQADLLILAGDIGNQRTLPIFFDRLRQSAPHLPTLMVLGNHERFHLRLDESVPIYKELCQQFNIRLLDNEAVIFQDVLFCGTTLWSNFQTAVNQEEAIRWSEEHLYDFKMIYEDEHTLLRAQTMIEYNQQAQVFLHESLQKVVDVRKKVVISHFLPSIELIEPTYLQDEYARNKTAYWANELPDLYNLCDVWLYGHSHCNVVKTINRTLFLSNQRGSSYVRNVARSPDYDRGFLYTL